MSEYTHKVKYKHPATGEEMSTGLCRDLNDAILKASMLNGVVVDVNHDVVWTKESGGA